MYAHYQSLKFRMYSRCNRNSHSNSCILLCKRCCRNQSILRGFCIFTALFTNSHGQGGVESQILISLERCFTKDTP